MVNGTADQGYILLAMDARRNGEWDTEKGYLHRGLGSNPGSTSLRLALGEALIRREEYLSAGVYLEMVVAYGDAREKGRAQQSVDDAIQSIEKPTSITDPQLESIIILYELQEKMSDGNEAKRDQGYKELAQIYYDLGLYQRAISKLNAIKENSDLRRETQTLLESAHLRLYGVEEIKLAIDEGRMAEEDAMSYGNLLISIGELMSGPPDELRRVIDLLGQGRKE
jgi:tetratricopeptide (TPR) repeat protein